MIQIHIICKMDDDEMIPIPGFESHVISKTGIIASLLSGIILKQTLRVRFDGYKSVTINLYKEDGQRATYLVSRLVAKAFIPNPDDLPTVDHIDRNSLNNHVSNLRWASYQTQAMNKHHPIGTSGHRHIYKRRNGWQVLIRRHNNIVFDKYFKTIEAAIQARDTFIAALSES